MRSVRTFCAALFAALSIVVFGAGPSFACSCVSRDAAAFVDSAEVVVSGTVIEVVPPPSKAVMSSMDPATYHLTVDTVYKGDVGTDLLVLSPNSGASCGLENIEPGRRYVVFASHQSMQGRDADNLWADLCGGTAPASPAFVSAVETAAGGGAPPSVVQANGAAYESDLTVAMDDNDDGDGDDLAGWAWPLGLVAGASLVLLTGALWVRYLRT